MAAQCGRDRCLCKCTCYSCSDSTYEMFENNRLHEWIMFLVLCIINYLGNKLARRTSREFSWTGAPHHRVGAFAYSSTLLRSILYCFALITQRCKMADLSKLGTLSTLTFKSERSSAYTLRLMVEYLAML